ncbi:phage protein Gp36 family protein [Spirosoma aerolatum]|uniref:phage protein Gp36 family protein n=1 Tax=Spirosoma aerolatum TaxID=1211326 RepID=UPI0009AD4FF4|nr:phage protein Gp36 family protein [Spirosoma aerolatum]
MLLTKQDLNSSLYPEISGMMARYSDAIIAACLNDADGILTAYLGVRYDIAVELAKSGPARNGYLLALAKDIAIYRLYTLQETIPKHRELLYTQAIEQLKMIQAGKGTLPGISPAPVPDPLPVGQISYGSNPRRATLLGHLPGPMEYS